MSVSTLASVVFWLFNEQHRVRRWVLGRVTSRGPGRRGARHLRLPPGQHAALPPRGAPSRLTGCLRQT
ncbi:hypothetical protein E2C01_083214 [Portunus trituberculatus]|uniref:Uncharacterized protein n=1 Tax=Portunus trituberculatus TaxID=210409 RepID=A0A5B7J1D1_PORTR|nr:hypothetical protein [Portunus trituberculatus]